MEKKIRKIMTWVFITTFLLVMPVQATEVVVSKINSLYELVMAIVTSVGVIVLAWGIFEFASAYQSHDSSQQTVALKKVISGILMVGAPTIINLLK